MANEENKKNGMDEGMQVVAFKLRDEEYGVSILNVQEIRNLTDITRVPFAADFIKGVINLRGSVLPVIDLKQRLGLAETPYTDNTRIVTVNIDRSTGQLANGGNSRAEYFIEGTQPTQQAVREVGTTLTDGGGETHELF